LGLTFTHLEVFGKTFSQTHAFDVEMTDAHIEKLPTVGSKVSMVEKGLLMCHLYITMLEASTSK
jgi:hypothetical protein